MIDVFQGEELLEPGANDLGLTCGSGLYLLNRDTDYEHRLFVKPTKRSGE